MHFLGQRVRAVMLSLGPVMRDGDTTCALPGTPGGPCEALRYDTRTRKSKTQHDIGLANTATWTIPPMVTNTT